MAIAFQKFQVLSENIAEKVHNFDTDTIKIALSNAGPSAANDDTLSDITEISAGNGYSAGGFEVTVSTSRSGGTTSVVGVDGSLTASGGSIGPFQYVILYNDTPTSPADPLIGFWNLGSTFTIPQDGEFVFDFGSSLFTIA
jgi:hypothetical protein